MGHKLFNTTPETFPVPFIQADAFDDKYLVMSPIPNSPPTDPLPPLNELKSLTPLIGRLSAIHTSSFFHLFSEEKQFELAQKIAGLLSPAPGSTIFGMHAGLAEKGFSKEGNRRTGGPLFCHSPDSWKELWDGVIFKQGTVKVEATLRNAVDVFEIGRWKEAAEKEPNLLKSRPNETDECSSLWESLPIFGHQCLSPLRLVDLSPGGPLETGPVQLILPCKRSAKL